jgi:hypothetical protein
MAAPAKQRKPENELQTREESGLVFRAALEPKSANDAERTIDLVWTTGSAVRRYDWRTGADYLETLSMNPKHVRTERMNDGGPVLDSHARWSVKDVIGAVVPGTFKLDGERGTATVRFSKRDDVTPVWQDVKAGIVRSVSVGYQIHKWERTAATEKEIEQRKAIDWEPHEISMVPIPADAGAGTRSADEALAQTRAGEAEMDAEEKKAMEEKAKREAEEKAKREAEEKQQREIREADAKREAEEKAQREAEEAAKRAKDAADAATKRAAAVAALCDEFQVAPEQRNAWLSEGRSVSECKIAILDGMAARSKESHISPVTGGDGRREQMAVRDAADAILMRAGEKVEGDGHRNFAGGRLLRMAEQILGMGGVNTRLLDPNELAKRALATSDFASVLYLVGEKQVRKGYEGVPLVHRAIFRKTTANDFREKNQVLVSAGGMLQEIPENGVIPMAGATSEQSKYKIKSYGLMYAFTRKMIIDDDISAVTKIAQSRGRSVAETERKLVWDFIMSNTLAGPTSQDGTAVFTTGHGNYPNASGTPISDVTLTAARVSFGNRLGPDGFAMNAQLKHIVTSVVGEAPWDILLNGMWVPQSNTGVVVTDRMRQVQLHVEPLISTTKKHWYGFADYNQVDHFEYAYLAGAEGARLEQRNGFNPEGIEYKVCMDFGIGAIDWRGAYLQRET